MDENAIRGTEMGTCIFNTAVDWYKDQLINQHGLPVLAFHQIVNSGATSTSVLTSDFKVISDCLKTKADAVPMDVELFTEYNNGYY
jgi:hypothetical protein